MKKMIKISDILCKEDIETIKEACAVFNAQYVEIDGVRYNPPKKNKKTS
jgi:hypothetical protein